MATWGAWPAATRAVRKTVRGPSAEENTANSGTHLKIEAHDGAQVIASAQGTRKPRGSYFQKDIVPAIPGEDTGYPSVVVNEFGKGTSVYFGGQPDQLFNRQGHPDYEQLLVNAVTWVSPQPQVWVEAPNTVEATYWRLDSGGYLVHILNHTYDAIFPAPASAAKVPASREVFRAVTQVISVRDVRIRLSAKPSSVTLLVGDSRLAVDDALVTLDELGEYAVVKIE